MALIDSNTYIEPTAGTGLNTARSQQNNNFRSLLTNFASVSAPTTINLTSTGSNFTVPDGTLFHNTSVSALYVSDSSSQTSYPMTGTNFTRRGISYRLEPTIAAAMSNVGKYELGELIHVVTGTEANSRIYLKMTAGGQVADVGVSPDNSVSRAQLKDTAVSSAKTQFVGTEAIIETNIDTGSRAGLTRSHTLDLFGNLLTGLGNVGIVFNAANAVSNVGLKIVQSLGTFPASGENAGLLVTANTGNDLAPIGANVIMQSITGANAITDTASSQTVAPLIPVGTMVMWGSTSIPAGWLLCNGDGISRTTYAGLFAAISTTYGVGNGSTTFNIPDFRDRLPLGKGTNNSSLNAATTGAAASAVQATASGTASLSPTTATFATSAKDSSTTSALTAVSAGGHTHNLTIPSIVVNYIIKS